GIEGAYLVTDVSPIRSTAEVDRPGVRVAVSTGSAYDLYLSRELKHASIVRAPTAKDVVGMFVMQQLDVAAGVRPMLEAEGREISELRMLPGTVHGDQPGNGNAAGAQGGRKISG